MELLQHSDFAIDGLGMLEREAIGTLGVDLESVCFSARGAVVSKVSMESW